MSKTKKIEENKIITIADFIEKIWKKEFQKRLDALKAEDVEVFCDGPNIIFKNYNIEYNLNFFKFKKNSDHKYWKNCKGVWGMFVVFNNIKKIIYLSRFRDQSQKQLMEKLTKEVRKKFDKAIKILKVFLESGEYQKRTEDFNYLRI